MKRCPHCGRDYPDETLNFCLDDGSELLFGPREEQPTLIEGVRNKRTDPNTAILPNLPVEDNRPRTSAPSRNILFRSPFVFAAAAVVLLTAIILASRFEFRPAAAAIHSLAVLPLENLSGDPSQEYFSDGMTDALISDLSQIRSLKVISRTSVMSFKGSRRSLPEIARTLGVDAIVEGTVTRGGGRVRVSAQLVPASTDSAIWSRNYEREMSDLVKLQADVAQAIASEIRIKVTSAEQQRLTDSKSVNPEAAEEFLLGNYHLQKPTDANLELAINHFTRAIAIEPEYADAWAGLSSAWFQRGIWGKYSYADVESTARNAAQRALDLNPDLSSAQVAMCRLNMDYDRDWQAVETHAKRAIELDPSNWDAYDAYAWFLLIFGRFDELKQVMSTAEQLDPVSSNLQSDFGRMLYRARLFGDAENHLNKAIELDDNNLGAYGRLADLMSVTGRFDEALAVLQKGKEKGDRPAFDIRKAVVLAQMGKKDAALEVWDRLALKPSVDEARLSTVFGDFDNAFEALNRALDQHEAVLPHLRVDPGFDKLHSDSRWAKFLARMNLPPS